MKAAIVCDDTAGEVVERTGKFDAGEAAAGDEERQVASPYRLVRLAVGAFEHVDDTITYADRVGQRFELHGDPFDRIVTEKIADRPEREHEVIESNARTPVASDRERRAAAHDS